MAIQVLRKPRLDTRMGQPRTSPKLPSSTQTPTIHISKNDLLRRTASNLPEQYAGTGTMMLTASFHLLHMDPRANDLSRCIAAQTGRGAHGTIPTQILELCSAVQRHGSFQIRTVTTLTQTTGPHIIVLYGFEIPDLGGEPSRILVLLKETKQDEWPIHRAVERFGLTLREETVVRHLAMGYTNKEIANALCIAEQTVKEHMKHLMLKTGATTRTGLLARVLSLASRQAIGHDATQIAGSLQP